MAFPVTPRYFIRFRNSDTGLTPIFTYFRRADTFAVVTPPTINESPAGGGVYYFDFTFTTANDPDIIFGIDGGASIPTEEVRYIHSGISPKNHLVDAPISGVPAAVWNDALVYSSGTKGRHVDDIGLPGDTSAAPTVFGKTLLYKESIKGTNDRDITQIAGTGTFVPATDNLHEIAIKTANLPSDPADESVILAAITSSTTSIKGAGNRDNSQIYDRIGAPTGLSIAADIAAVPANVWKITRAAHITTGDMGETIKILHLIHRGHVKINNTTKRLEVYNEADTLIEFEMSLFDLAGVASSVNPTERRIFP